MQLQGCEVDTLELGALATSRGMAWAHDSHGAGGANGPDHKPQDSVKAGPGPRWIGVPWEETRHASNS